MQRDERPREGFRRREREERKPVDEKEEQTKQLKTVIVRLGDPSTTPLENNIEGCAALLEKELARNEETILEILMRW
jgi:hypothetical protein